MVTAYACVDVIQQLLPLVDGNASLKDFRGASTVETPVDDHEGLSVTCHAPRFNLIDGELPLNKVFLEYDPPVGIERPAA